MFVLGTAGHIDHGKSSLVKALTGIDPDRLPEEKQRGMTIDLGFAWLKLPDGSTAGLVDVPGHERFVRNMVAGAGGINAAMLVIAADDGWMPQTQEHFDILRLLDIGHGLVALTKIDLVEKEWIELITTDIRDRLKGTFLETAPIIPCSALTGEGVDRVALAMAEISRRLQTVDDICKPRLFIDRAFVMPGIGVVVTGTSRDGGFTVESDIFQFPGRKRVRIRAMQSYGQTVSAVGPGCRVAVNLGGLNRGDINRGDLLTGFEYSLSPSVFAASITNLDNSTITLREGRRVLVIHGTTETEGVMRPLTETGIKPGNTDLAVIKTARPLAAFVGDRFILRLPTPAVTVGGGVVLDLLDRYPYRKELPRMRPNLVRRAAGTIDDLLLAETEKKLFTDSESILEYSRYSRAEITSAVNGLIESGLLVRHDSVIASASRLQAASGDLVRELETTHKKKSYLRGLTVEELRRRLDAVTENELAILLKYLEQSGQVSHTQQFYHLSGFAPILDTPMTAQADAIMAAAEKAGHEYLSPDDIEARFPQSRRTMVFLKDEGRLRVVGNQFIISRQTWSDILVFIESRFESGQTVTVADIRNHFHTTRKYAVPLLEYLDQLKITRREGDIRVRGADYDERHSL